MKNKITGLLVGVLSVLIISFALAERREPVETISKKTFSPPQKTETYVVKNGDTLSAIAARIPNPSWDSDYLAKLNNLTNPSLIKPGQKLKVPVK